MPKTATYADVLTVPLNRVRFEVSDIDCDNAHLSDAEIQFLIDEGGPVLLAASKAADQIANSYATLVTEKIGATSKAYKELRESFRTMARDLRLRAGYGATATAAVSFYVGGISEDEAVSDRADDDLIQPEFERDQFRNPGTVGDVRDTEP